MSRKLIVKMSITLDGFVCGPNGEMDWMFPSRSEDGAQWVLDIIESAGLQVFGARNFLEMAQFWPNSPLPFAAPMNRIPKMVFSRTGTLPEFDAAAAPGSWTNPFIGGADLVGKINELKAADGPPILAQGGASFVGSLIEHKLVDEFYLATHPVALGQGKPIFDKLSAPVQMRLIDCRIFSTGAMGKVFEPKY